MDKVIGIGDYAMSDQESDKLVTFALSSCVAVTVYSPEEIAAGMIHVVLPTPSLGFKASCDRICYYAETGIPFLINQMCKKYGCSKDSLEIKLFGGAVSPRSDDYFKVGTKNVQKAVEVLQGMDLDFTLAEVGGTFCRTIEFDVASGQVRVKRQPLMNA